jgi:drug/metabolite transporter (DMT)-like permease
MVLFVLANKLTTAANAIFLQGSAPIYVMLLGPWLLREKTSARQLGFMAVLAFGMSLFFVGSQPATSTASNPIIGNILGAGTGLAWAMTITGLRWLGRGAQDVDATSSAVCCGNLLAAAATLPMALPVHDSASSDWTIVAFLGVVQIAVAYAVLIRGVARVPALEASLLLLAEPVLSPFWAWLVHGEIPTVWALFGGVVILGATAVMALSSQRES